MNPPKTCDPTAVSSTLNVRKELGQNGTEGLSELQRKIYNLVVEKGTISREDLMATLGLTPAVFEREFAVLRHCELLRGFKEDGSGLLRKILSLASILLAFLRFPAIICNGKL